MSFRKLFCRFDRGERDAHIAAFDRGGFVGGAELGAGSPELLDHRAADVHMGHLTPLEADDNAHFVAFLQKTAGRLDAGIKIVGIDAAGELHFLDLDDLLFLLGFLFFFEPFKTVFAVVHGTANGRLGRRRDHHQIDVVFLRIMQSGLGFQNPELFPVHAHKAHFGNADILVELQIFGTDKRILHKQKSIQNLRMLYLLPP